LDTDSSQRAEDYVLYLDTGTDEDEAKDKRFEATCNALANKNTRRILRSLFARPSSVAEIAASTRLTIQCVSEHIARLEKLGIVDGDGLVSLHLRGRSGRRFKISKFAVILMPLDISNSEKIHNFIHQKLKEKLRVKALLNAFLISLGWALSALGLEDYLSPQTSISRGSSGSLGTSLFGTISKMMDSKQTSLPHPNLTEPIFASLILVSSIAFIFSLVYLWISRAGKQ